MRVATMVRVLGFDPEPSFQVEGVPTLRRVDRAAVLTLGPRRRLALDTLPVGTEVQMRLLGSCGSYDDRDVARLRRTERGVEVERAHDTLAYDVEGPDEEVPAFAPHRVDVMVDGVVVASVPLVDEFRAPATFLRAMDAIRTEPGSVGTYEVRGATRLPWRLDRRLPLGARAA